MPDTAQCGMHVHVQDHCPECGELVALTVHVDSRCDDEVLGEVVVGMRERIRKPCETCHVTTD